MRAIVIILYCKHNCDIAANLDANDVDSPTQY